jgi:hypothetical protein
MRLTEFRSELDPLEAVQTDHEVEEEAEGGCKLPLVAVGIVRDRLLLEVEDMQ